MQRLRQTLHAVLTGSGDLDEVAAELLVHKNTIRYRVRQAEEVLGYKAKDRRADLEVAPRHMEAFGRL
jgi:DNA-binding PucR family transcriptional regulator